MKYSLMISVFVALVLVKCSIALKPPYDGQEDVMSLVYDRRDWRTTMAGDHMHSRGTFGGDRKETRRVLRSLRVTPPSVPSPNPDPPIIQGPPVPPSSVPSLSPNPSIQGPPAPPPSVPFSKFFRLTKVLL
ncbi:hypothetical protein Droror1_Dr00012412 [Drosera rotundifolia]